MTRVALLAGVCLLCSCDAVIGELGEAERPPDAVLQSTPRITKLDCTPLTGDAPLTVTCQLEVLHPDGKPVSCSIEPGSGEAATMVSDCLNPQMLSFTYATPGSYALKVLASDPDLGHLSAMVAIIANVRPNQAPVIDGFSGSPMSGGAPFSPTLTWTISDPEGDVLTCKIDDTPVDCAMPFPVTVPMPGTKTVTLTVTDSYGGTTTKTLTLTAVMPVGDVRIAKVEWAQTVILTDLKLVAQKPALLRVHVVGDKPSFTGVTAEVTGKLGTTDLGKLTLTGPATIPTTEVPADLSKQFTVTLPAEWIEPMVEITLKIDAADALPETDEANNVQLLKPVVGKGNVMQLTAVPVIHQGMTPTITNLEGPLTRIWPMKGVETQTRAPYTYSGVLSGGDAQAWANLLDDLAQLRQMDGSSRNYYGLVRVSYGSGVAGIGYIGQETAVGRDDSIETAQHELGHNMGRNHAPCGGAAGADPSYPYAGAKIGSWGYDAVSKQLKNPATFVDLMSYCQPEWVSDFNYKRVQTYLETQPYIPPSTAPYLAAVAVSGRFGAGGVTLRPVHRVRAQLPVEVPFTGRSLRVRFVGGAERVVALVTHQLADLDAPEESFSALVEDLGPIAAIDVFERGGLEVLTQKPLLAPEAAAHAKLERISQNELELSWDSARYPYAAVTHVNDVARTTLALSLRGGRARVRIDGLDDGRFELSLSEGLDAALVVLPMPAR